MANGPDINGIKYDYASVSIDLLGKLSGVKEIKYKNTLAGNKTRQLGSREASGRAGGELDCEASMVMYRKEYDELINRLGDGYMSRVFNITVTHAEINQPTVSDQIIGCKLTGDDHSAATGGDALEVSVDLQPMRVFPGGKKPILGMAT